jgi:Ca-activated chloride channel homolog
MTFANPHVLWLLLVFPPALVAFFWWSWRKRQTLMERFIEARLLPGLLSGISPARNKVRCGLLVLGVMCLIVALARPQWGFTWEEVKQRGLDIVVAVDTSKSMLAEDIPPNRLARAKLAALELMQRAKSDRLGLVAFAGSAFLQCPLTIDDAVFRQSVEALDVHTISEGGTAIAEAINTAMTAFKEGDNHKVLVLITDGEDHDSGAVEAAKKGAEAGLQIFTVGIGSTEGELLRIKGANGTTDYIRDEQGNVVKSHLDEKTLQQLAGVSERGFYVHLQGAKAIDTLYEQGLSRLPKSEANERLTKRMHERYHWPLALGILLLIAEMLFPERKQEAKPKVPLAPVPAAKPALKRVAALLFLVALPLAVFGSPGSALRDYKSEQYDQALKEYEQLLKTRGDDPRLHYNAGNSAYRNHQFEEADKQFEAALASPDLKLQSRAYYNRGNTRFYLGAGAPDPKLRSEMWKKALQDYQSAMKLEQQDTDAKHNYEFVKKRLEELQQQQQQSQNDKSDQQQDQDQQKQQQQNQQKQDQQKDQNQQQQQQQQQAQQKQSEEKDKQQSQGQQKQPEQQQQQQQAQEQQKKQQQANQASAQPKDKSDEKDPQEGKAYAEGQMTPQQAQQLLDAQKGDEQMLPPEKPNQKPPDSNRPIRDW